MNAIFCCVKPLSSPYNEALDLISYCEVWRKGSQAFGPYRQEDQGDLLRLRCWNLTSTSLLAK